MAAAAAALFAGLPLLAMQTRESVLLGMVVHCLCRQSMADPRVAWPAWFMFTVLSNKRRAAQRGD